MAKYHEYYDKLNASKKDYHNEVQRLKRSYDKLCDLPLDKILEVGSGTGSHTKFLCDITDFVVACDIDPEMVEVSRDKLKGLPVDLYDQGIGSVGELEFPFCVMMWHVLNYFPDTSTMISVFSEVSNRLQKGGIFIFDAWNGVAVIRDLPKHVTNTFEVDGLKIIHELRGTTDLMSQTTTILNHIEVYENQNLKDQFTQEVVHYIWTAKVVTDLLKESGFEVVKVTKSGNYDLEADHNDWKVAYIARKL